MMNAAGSCTTKLTEFLRYLLKICYYFITENYRMIFLNITNKAITN